MLMSRNQTDAIAGRRCPKNSTHIMLLPRRDQTSLTRCCASIYCPMNLALAPRVVFYVFSLISRPEIRRTWRELGQHFAMLAIQTQTTAGQYPKVLWDKPAGLRWPRAGIVVFAYSNSFDTQSAENGILRSSYYIIISVVRKASTHIKVCFQYYSLILFSVLSCFGAEILSNNNSSSTSGNNKAILLAQAEYLTCRTCLCSNEQTMGPIENIYMYVHTSQNKTPPPRRISHHLSRPLACNSKSLSDAFYGPRASNYRICV